MRKISIFEKHNKTLFSVKFDGDEKDELDKVLDFWRDVEELRAFFIHYRRDLSEFDPGMSVNEAVQKVVDDSLDILDRLIEHGDANTFDDLFKPLDDREKDEPRYELQKLKVAGQERKSMIRIYAIKFGNRFVVTGGAIKLKDKMKGRPHTQGELDKLELVRKFLAGTDPTSSIVYLEI